MVCILKMRAAKSLGKFSRSHSQWQSWDSLTGRATCLTSASAAFLVPVHLGNKALEGGKEGKRGGGMGGGGSVERDFV